MLALSILTLASTGWPINYFNISFFVFASQITLDVLKTLNNLDPFGFEENPLDVRICVVDKAVKLFCPVIYSVPKL